MRQRAARDEAPTEAYLEQLRQERGLTLRDQLPQLRCRQLGELDACHPLHDQDSPAQCNTSKSHARKTTRLRHVTCPNLNLSCVHAVRTADNMVTRATRRSQRGKMSRVKRPCAEADANDHASSQTSARPQHFQQDNAQQRVRAVWAAGGQPEAHRVVCCRTGCGIRTLADRPCSDSLSSCCIRCALAASFLKSISVYNLSWQEN